MMQTVSRAIVSLRLALSGHCCYASEILTGFRLSLLRWGAGHRVSCVLRPILIVRRAAEFC